ncbi:AcrR family transcriptional regulator [Spinactinospora alkalitolerans]|uniref:AcrR family transcriptional regulator n=1 Tax=Spinactinospora alkalitolerans TaxID=687207 RepID=A0A852TWQ4_9ACTN|nr:TetR/AcrR family transcriptional regulator [Spinactinospora alkalitolerans]NYE48946.1 AcrR family transcriptional regulator [Spinactinospora alkalitolerans]
MTADLSPLDTRLTERALDVAIRLFARDGTRDVRMSDIAHEADVDPVDLRRAFPTKLDLIHAIIVRSTRQLLERQMTVSDEEKAPVERLSLFIRTHIEFSSEHRTEEELRRSVLPTLRAINPSRHREISDLLRGYREHVRGLIAAGRDAGVLAPSRPAVAAASVLETLDGILNWYDPSGGLSVQELGNVYADMIIHHLLGAPPE